MDLTFQANGNLPKGIHVMLIEEFETKFGSNSHRKKLIEGLKRGMSHLKDCGCKTIFIDGSFVTTKEMPGDFDACWDSDGVDFPKLVSQYSTLVDFDDHRKNQKNLYFGEFFPASIITDGGVPFIAFFQKDKNGDPKGIVQIDLN